MKKRLRLIPFSEILAEAKKDPVRAARIDSYQEMYELLVEMRRQRIRQAMTQIELSRKSEIPQRTISEIETGKRNPTIQTLVSLSAAMGKRLKITLV